MHDRNGMTLKVGDVVTLEMVITQTSGGEDYCNVTAKSTTGRKPDGCPETFSGNSAVLTLAKRMPDDKG